MVGSTRTLKDTSTPAKTPDHIRGRRVRRVNMEYMENSDSNASNTDYDSDRSGRSDDSNVSGAMFSTPSVKRSYTARATSSKRPVRFSPSPRKPRKKMVALFPESPNHRKQSRKTGGVDQQVPPAKRQAVAEEISSSENPLPEETPSQQDDDERTTIKRRPGRPLGSKSGGKKDDDEGSRKSSRAVAPIVQTATPPAKRQAVADETSSSENPLPEETPSQQDDDERATIKRRPGRPLGSKSGGKKDDDEGSRKSSRAVAPIVQTAPPPAPIVRKRPAKPAVEDHETTPLYTVHRILSSSIPNLYSVTWEIEDGSVLMEGDKEVITHHLSIKHFNSKLYPTLWNAAYYALARMPRLSPEFQQLLKTVMDACDNVLHNYMLKDTEVRDEETLPGDVINCVSDATALAMSIRRFTSIVDTSFILQYLYKFVKACNVSLRRRGFDTKVIASLAAFQRLHCLY